MATLNPYITFDGDCQEAMTLYADTLGGQITGMNPYSEMPDAPAGTEGRLMHCEVKAGDVVIMACDIQPGHPLTAGNNITLNINLTDTAQQADIFAKLSAGGKVVMPLEDTFWGARFGMLVDKFGISWMLNCYPPQG